MPRKVLITKDTLEEILEKYQGGSSGGGVNVESNIVDVKFTSVEGILHFYFWKEKWNEFLQSKSLTEQQFLNGFNNANSKLELFALFNQLFSPLGELMGVNSFYQSVQVYDRNNNQFFAEKPLVYIQPYVDDLDNPTTFSLTVYCLSGIESGESNPKAETDSFMLLGTTYNDTFSVSVSTLDLVNVTGGQGSGTTQNIYVFSLKTSTDGNPISTNNFVEMVAKISEDAFNNKFLPELNTLGSQLASAQSQTWTNINNVDEFAAFEPQVHSTNMIGMATMALLVEHSLKDNQPAWAYLQDYNGGDGMLLLTASTVAHADLASGGQDFDVPLNVLGLSNQTNNSCKDWFTDSSASRFQLYFGANAVSSLTYTTETISAGSSSGNGTSDVLYKHTISGLVDTNQLGTYTISFLSKYNQAFANSESLSDFLTNMQATQDDQVMISPQIILTRQGTTYTPVIVNYYEVNLVTNGLDISVVGESIEFLFADNTNITDTVTPYIQVSGGSGSSESAGMQRWVFTFDGGGDVYINVYTKFNQSELSSMLADTNNSIDTINTMMGISLNHISSFNDIGTLISQSKTIDSTGALTETLIGTFMGGLCANKKTIGIFQDSLFGKRTVVNCYPTVDAQMQIITNYNCVIINNSNQLVTLQIIGTNANAEYEEI